MTTNDELTFSLGARLRLVREKAQMSAEDMADAMAISSSTVKNWELGYAKPTPRKVRRWVQIVAQRSDFSVDDLLRFIDIEWVETVHERRRIERRTHSDQPKDSIRCITRSRNLQFA